MPVVVVPLPVTRARPAAARRCRSRCRTASCSCSRSTSSRRSQRKNPLGLVEAFKQAFEPGEGPTLLLKTINARFRPEARERLRYAIGDRDDIRLVDALLEPAEMAALFRRADCYVSLHRAEGFGLTLAESMALGKPVIATGFSGNTDFMTPANSYLVDWTLTDVGPDAEHYPEDGTWAEPSLEHAAQLLREVYGDREARRALAARAPPPTSPPGSRPRRSARSRATGSCGSAAAAPGGAARAGRGCRARAGDFEHRLEFDLGGGDRGGPKGAGPARAVPRHAPYTASERALDRALAAAIRRLALELHADRAPRSARAGAARASARSARRASRPTLRRLPGGAARAARGPGVDGERAGPAPRRGAARSSTS